MGVGGTGVSLNRRLRRNRRRRRSVGWDFLDI
jgi:hypothetical protein